MIRRLRETGPVVLVPLAWTFATVAHADLITTRTVLIAHLVMDVIIAVFTVLSWREMRSGVLLAWKLVLLGGLVITLAGTVGLLIDPIHTGLLFGTVVGWMVLPAAGLAYTSARVERRPWAYGVGAGQSAVGAVAYVLAAALSTPSLQFTALAFAGVGQTIGIVAAVVSY